jgi:hypothetical protein
MANSIGWGQGSVNNNNGWGKGAINNNISWGAIQSLSYSPETNLTGGSEGFSDTTSWSVSVDEFLNNSTTFDTIPADDGASGVKYTLNAWIKLDSLSGTQVIYYVSESDGTLVAYLLVTSSGRLQAFVSGSGSNWAKSGTGTIAVDTWYMVSLRYNSPSSSRYHRLSVYVNGVKPTGHTSNFLIANAGSSANINIGNTYSDTNHVNGHINEPSIFYGHALSGSQLTDLYNSGMATDLNENTPTPTHWFRSENASWDGSKYTMNDEMETSLTMVTNNMEQDDKDSDVPS